MKAILLAAFVGLFAMGPLVMTVGAHEPTNETVLVGEQDAPGGPMYYDPAFLQLGVGSTVTWLNVGAKLHEVSFHFHGPGAEVPLALSFGSPGEPPEFEVVIGASESVSYTFLEPGVYQTHCNLGGTHNAAHGVIVVLDM